jgi:betaine-homocysteine S-methyltransferase
MILELLKNDIVLGDGGAIFELERRGYVSAGPFTPEVVIEHPEALKQLQTDFARAGAQVLQALTYYAHEEKLKDIGKVDALARIMRAGRILAAILLLGGLLGVLAIWLIPGSMIPLIRLLIRKRDVSLTSRSSIKFPTV